jgi:hypothetical protein
MKPRTENCYTRILLFWTKQLNTPYHKVSKNVLREVSSYLVSLPLIALFSGYLNVFSKRRKQHQLAQSFTSGTVFVRADADTVVCLGGFPPSSMVFTLNLRHREILSLRGMQAERCLCGAIKAGLYIYVFGSYPGNTSCEKLAIREERWCGLPSMSTIRYAFSPALYQQTIYLPDVFKSPTFEAFSLTSETFSTLPIDLLVLGSFSVAFFAESKLVIVACSGHVATWKVGSLEPFVVAPCKLPSKIAAVSNTPPVCHRGSFYWVQNSTGALVKFSLPNTIAEVEF